MASEDRYKRGRYEPDVILPFPELIDGKTTEFVPSNGITGAVGRAPDGRMRMTSPVDPPELALRIQMHEECHREWSPMEDGKTFADYAKKAKVDPMIVAALEDTRLNYLLREQLYRANSEEYANWRYRYDQHLKGKGPHPGEWRMIKPLQVLETVRLLSDTDVKRIKSTGTKLQRLLVSLASLYTADASVNPDKPTEEGCLPDYLLDSAEQVLMCEVQDQITKKPSFKQMLKSAQHIAKRMGEWAKNEEEAKRLSIQELAGGKKAASGKEAEELKKLLQEAAMKAVTDPRTAVKVNPKGLKREPAKILKDYSKKTNKQGREILSAGPGAPNWVPMEIDKPPLDRPYKPKANARGKRYRNTEEGHHLRRMDRYMTDGRIFSTKKVDKAASVLIDASGSMGFSEEDIYKLLEALPAVRVAMYCANGNGGYLTILAKDGKMVSKIHRQGGNNGCDGLALRWLAEQPLPRVWYSDGFVTGRDDECRKNLLEDAASVCEAAKIVRVDTLADALKILKLHSGGEKIG